MFISSIKKKPRAITMNLRNIFLLVVNTFIYWKMDTLMKVYIYCLLYTSNNWIQYLPVITITSDTASQSIDKAYDLGVCDYINRPFDDLIVQKRVQNTILLNAKHKQLENLSLIHI